MGKKSEEGNSRPADPETEEKKKLRSLAFLKNLLRRASSKPSAPLEPSKSGDPTTMPVKKRHHLSALESDVSSGPDLFGLLPDCILIQILSLLSLKESARTSVLSTRWRHLWTLLHGRLQSIPFSQALLLRPAFGAVGISLPRPSVLLWLFVPLHMGCRRRRRRQRSGGLAGTRLGEGNLPPPPHLSPSSPPRCRLPPSGCGSRRRRWHHHRRRIRKRPPWVSMGEQSKEK